MAGAGQSAISQLHSQLGKPLQDPKLSVNLCDNAKAKFLFHSGIQVSLLEKT